jgi:O-acetyl-ADP-ribose deacetylase (regulator of RNase III)
MDITYIKGDLFKTDEHVIVHGCNARGVMGSGVAAIVKEKYPEAYKRYRQFYEDFDLELGSIIPVNSNGKLIINAITQDRYGTAKRHADYQAISIAISKVDYLLKTSNIQSFAMPMIGAGLAGGDWKVISAIVESETKYTTPIVYYL